jgi:Flp pilus assembly protein TadG
MGEDERGASAVEFALILPIFLLLIFGIVQYGTIFLVKNQMTQAASDAARSAVTYSSVSSAITAAETALTTDIVHDSDGLIPSSDSCGTAAMTCTAVQETTGCNVPTGYECLKVTVSFDYADHPVIAFPFLPSPSSLTASSTVIIGGGNLQS